jgi:hypothetical protein
MQVFAKRFYDFDPVGYPVAAFGIEGNRDALISMSGPGDLLVFVGTQGEPTPVGERGRLLGLVEFAPIAVATEDFVDRSALRAHDLNPDGTLVWPKALPILRAWRFDDPRFKLIDVLKEQLTYEATVRAVLLDADDSAAVLALPKTEIVLPQTEARRKLLRLVAAVAQPTTGPRPSDWFGEVSRSAAETAYTYAMRFGRRDLWKIGHAQDLAARLQDINKHVPHEVLGEKWSLVMQQKWQSSVGAYEMEQRVLARLQTHRTEGERVLCPETVVFSAWGSSLRER